MTARPRGGDTSRCPACRAPVIKQLVADHSCPPVEPDTLF